MEFVREFQGLIALAFNLMLALVVWAFRTQVRAMIADRAAAADLDALSSRVTKVDHRLIAVEHHLGALPSREQLNALALRIESLAGDVRTTLAQLSGTNEMLRGHARKLDLVEDWLRTESARGRTS